HGPHLHGRRAPVRARHGFREGRAWPGARRPGHRDGGDVPERAHRRGRDRGHDRIRRHRPAPVALPRWSADLRLLAPSGRAPAHGPDARRVPDRLRQPRPDSARGRPRQHPPAGRGRRARPGRPRGVHQRRAHGNPRRHQYPAPAAGGQGRPRRGPGRTLATDGRADGSRAAPIAAWTWPAPRRAPACGYHRFPHRIGLPPDMSIESLADTARAMVAAGKGILAIDESSATLARRFAEVGIHNSEANRRAYRELLLTAPGLGEWISGVILYDETIRQSTREGVPFARHLAGLGILPGIKVDKGTQPLAGCPGEVVTEGLDGLRPRLEEYYK